MEANCKYLNTLIARIRRRAEDLTALFSPVGLAFACMALVVPIWSQAAAVYYVSPSGSDANAGTNPSAPWKTVGKAVTNLVAGQTAYLRAGTYSEKKLLFQHSGSAGNFVTLAAYPGEQPIMDAGGATSGGIIDLNAQSYVQITGIQFQNGFQGIINGVNSSNPSMLSSHVLVQSNQFYNLASVAILLDYISSSAVLGNLASNTVSSSYGECISIAFSEYVDIAYNVVENSTTSTAGGEGLGIRGKHLRIYGNVIHDLNPTQRPGIYMDAYGSINNDIQAFNNIVYNCHEGVIVSSELGNRADNMWVYNNLVYNCYGYNMGVMNWDSGTYLLYNATFENNTVAQSVMTNNSSFYPQGLDLYAPQGTNIIIRNNIFYNYPSGNLITLGGGTPASQVFKYNNLSSNGTASTLGNNSVFADPKFANASSNNYQLQSSSAAINAGASNSLVFDLNFLNRPVGNKPDIGAYEYGASNAVAVPALTKPFFISFTNTVSQSSNDGYESNGVVNLTSTGGIISYTNSTSYTNQTIAAVRFTGVSIPQGAQIINAWITFKLNQFRAEPSIGLSSPITIQVNAENSGNSQPLATSAYNISSRNTTFNTAYWLPNWGNAGDLKVTPSLDNLITEVIARPDWTNGNPMTFLFKYNNTNSLAFDSYDSGAGNAPQLYVELIKPNSTITLASGTNFIYDGTAKTPNFSFTGSSGAQTYSYSGSGYGPSANAPTNSGNYIVAAMLAADANFNGATNSQSFTINPATATVTLGNLNQTYDGTAKSVTNTTSPPGLPVNLSYAGSLNPPTNAGSYQVIGTVANNNYVGSVTNSLVISPAVLTIIANNDTKVYGQTKTYGAGSTNFNSTGLAPSQTIGSVTITASGGTTANSSVGSYNLAPSAATGGTFNPTNYNQFYSNGTLTVTAAPKPLAQNISFSNGAVFVTFSGISGVTYVSQFTTNLTGSWTPFSTNTAPVGGVWLIADPTINSGQKFYRTTIP